MSKLKYPYFPTDSGRNIKVNYIIFDKLHLMRLFKYMKGFPIQYNWTIILHVIYFPVVNNEVLNSIFHV